MHPEEIVDSLERKVERLESVILNLLDAIRGDVDIPTDVAVAAGIAANTLRDIDIPFTS